MNGEIKEIVACGLSEGEISRLKAKHGELTLISIEGGNEFIFKKPDMSTISAAVAVGKDDPMAFNVILFNNCLVAGDRDAVEDASVMLSVSPIWVSYWKRKKLS